MTGDLQEAIQVLPWLMVVPMRRAHTQGTHFLMAIDADTNAGQAVQAFSECDVLLASQVQYGLLVETGLPHGGGGAGPILVCDTPQPPPPPPPEF